ncbi:MAG TPA: ATP-binding protein [Steroidobacteraceae bacterium]|nr:ATP-binding protein [Steroidobacteraceae bacterium]
MIARRLRPIIEDRLRQMPGVVLLGPRQVGKTTLARQIATARKARAMYLDLERPADQRRLQDADAFLRAQVGKLVVIDEIHRAPALFETLRGIIDDRRAAGDRAGHFLLLGSAAIELMRQASESLAGRVAYIDLAPIDALEYPAQVGDTDRLWTRGGFPDSLLAENDGASLNWRRAFIRSYLERDVPMFAPRMPAETIGRLWTMLAHSQATPLNQSKLASSLEVSTPAVTRYIDLLVDLLLVRRLRPWSGNTGKRLVRTPKVYVRDSGLTHALLDLESWEQVLGHPVAGPSWEGFAIENLVAVAGDRRTPYFYRTEDGAEIDLLFERGGSVDVVIEIKRSTAPTLSRGFNLARQALKPREAYLVHGGTDSWPMADGVTATGLRELMGRLADS